MLFRQGILFQDYETSYRRMKELCTHYSGSKDRNEAQTRLELIDDIFLGCLGWTIDDLQVEESFEGKYADYVFSAPRRMLIVEAKKEGDYFTLPSGLNRLDISLQTLCRDHKNLKSALEQVASYCQNRGVPFACVCNGHQLVAFVATRSDGNPPFEGKAFVFPSHESMLENFKELWNLLSKPGIEDKNLNRRLVENLTPEIPPKLADSIDGYPGTITRNTFQTDLQILSDLIIEDIARNREHEIQFLEACYSKSGSLSQYAMVSKKILEARYSAIFDEESGGPTLAPTVDKKGITNELMAESLSKRPILLIGDVGVGKTMFIRNLMKVEAPNVFQNAISLYIDLGTQATLTNDLRSFVANEIASQLENEYKIDIQEDKFVRGVYHGQLRKFERGIYGRYKEEDPNHFRRKEIEFLEELLKERDIHLKNSLEHISKGRRQQIIIFLDNVDQRDEETQQRCFLISQELAERWPATIFMTLRPETYHRSQRIGAISGYHPKAFTIAPPRVIDVIERRLNFAFHLTAGEIPVQKLTAKLSLGHGRLDVIIKVFLDSLRKEELAEAIDNISGGNVRLALDLIRDFFGSGHVDTQKIYKIATEEGTYIIPLHEFLRAIIYRDNVHYSPINSPIANIFSVSSFDPKEHFLLPILITYLDSLGGSGSDEGFVSLSKLYESLQALGFTPDQIDASIVKGHRKRLLETAARRIPESSRVMPKSIRITTVGKYHVNRICKQFAYIDAILVDVPLFDPSYKANIKNLHSLNERLHRAEIFCDYLDNQWNKSGLNVETFNWPLASKVLREDISRIKTKVSSQ